MTRMEVTAVLFIDCGVDDQGRRARTPRARYECLLCRTAEGPVYGRDRVAEFVARIRTDHPAHCTANPQGAHAA